MVLRVDRLSVFRGPAPVLRGVSLEVGEAEAVCLVGRNGAGKTTTMDAVMGLLPAASGQVVLKGQDITRRPTHARARLGIGYAPEDTGVFPDLTVAENFYVSRWLGRSRPARPSGADLDERILSVFPEVATFTQRRGLNLSGGQKKMVAIARAMALFPAILLLDEPFEGLAPVVVSRFIEAVQRIKAMGISLLIAESNLSTATRVADRLYVIDRGEVVFEGDPRSALQSDAVMRTVRG